MDNCKPLFTSFALAILSYSSSTSAQLPSSLLESVQSVPKKLLVIGKTNYTDFEQEVINSDKSIIGKQIDSPFNDLNRISTRWLDRINRKTTKIHNRLAKQTKKYLNHFAQKENKLKKALGKTDSTAAKNVLIDFDEQYNKFQNELNQPTDSSYSSISGEYMPYIDSLRGALSFISQEKNPFASAPKLQQAAETSLQQFNQLQNRLHQSDRVKLFVQARQQHLKNEFRKYTDLAKHLNGYDKQVYYYSTQLKEYKQLLNNPDRLTRKALHLLGNSAAFKKFLNSSSGQLAGLFNISAPNTYAAGMGGLQTRLQVQEIIRAQINSGGTGGMATFQQTLQQAGKQLGQLKDKISQLGEGTADIDMPQTKINPQKTKSFLKRLELGGNIQTSRSNNYMPTTTDFGLSIGYKWRTGITIGSGVAYKLGWGQPIRHIAFSNEGLSLRPLFCDLKLKGSLYGSASWEYNRQQLGSDVIQLEDLESWTQSALIGVTKIVSFKGKLIKKTKAQLLWDILSYQQIPRTQPIIFRIGYALH